MGRITDFINRLMFGSEQVLSVRVYKKTISIMHYDGTKTIDHKVVCGDTGYNIKADRDTVTGRYIINVYVAGWTEDTLQEGEY
jgi:hypothetical protein